MNKEKYIGKQCTINIKRNGKDLFYTAIITEITDHHIWFTDKFDNKYLFKMEYVAQICII